LRDGLLPRMGFSGAWCRAVDPRIKAGEGRCARCGLRLRYLPRLGFPRRRWKSPPLGLLPQNAWQSEEQGLRRISRPPTTSQRELRRANWAPSPILSAGAPRRSDAEQIRYLAGRRISAKAESRCDKFLLDQGCFLILRPAFGCSGGRKLSALDSATVWRGVRRSRLVACGGDRGQGRTRSSGGSAQHEKEPRLRVEDGALRHPGLRKRFSTRERCCG